MKNTIVTALAIVLLAGASAFAAKTKKHENKTPINDVAAEGIKDTNEAAAEGDLSGNQAHQLNKKHKAVEHAEQKNADLRHGLVSKGDHKKYNRKAHQVNSEREKVINQNVEEGKTEEQKH